MYSLIFLMSTLVNSSTLTVSSPSFKHNEQIPSKYTCDGINVNPALLIGSIPPKTKSLALIMDDPDAPNGTFDHWLLWNIPAKDKKVEENNAPGIQGKNGKGENGYAGPCPPSGTHHYHFKIYALDSKLDLEAGSDKQELEKAMKDHILGFGELIGTYKRP
jgi:Raf kinase inhibitor-like YbhB/YbcL family protein